MVIWFDEQTGSFGDGRNLVIVVLRDNEIDRFSEMSDGERIAYVTLKKSTNPETVRHL